MIYNSKAFSRSNTRTDDMVSREDKLKAPYLVTKTDQLINRLVRTYDRDLEISLRYHRGERDQLEFQDLTNNYGVGTPHKIGFTSLMNRHIKALVGYFLDFPFPFTVAATDRDSIWQAREEMAESLIQELNSIMASAASAWGEGEEGQATARQRISEQALQDIRQRAQTFTSRLEKFSSVLMDSLVDRLQLKDKMSKFVEQICVTGRLHYRVWLPESTLLPRFDPDIDPGSLHYSRTETQQEIRRHKGIVYHRRMPRTDVLTELGYLMTDTERQLVGGKQQSELSEHEWVALRPKQNVAAPAGQRDNSAYFDSIVLHRYGLTDAETEMGKLVDVYHVEWISSDEIEEDELGPLTLSGSLDTLEVSKDFERKGPRRRNNRYECIRVGSNIYLQAGMSKHVLRPDEDPLDCFLSYNGIDTGKSLIRQTKDLQDKWDLLSFHQDNLIAMGGVPGVMVDIDDMPLFLGKEPADRVSKWRGWLKQGLALIQRVKPGNRNQSQMGASGDQRFNNSGTIDTSFNGQSVAAIGEQMDKIEEVASRVSGVPRQMMAEIGERDAVGTTRQAMVSATKVNKPMYATVLRFSQWVMTDMLNLSRITAQYNPDAIGAMIGSVGARLVAKGAERFTLAQFNVHLKDAIEEKDAIERMRMAGQQLIEQLVVEPQLLIDIASINNVATLRSKLMDNISQQSSRKTQQLQQENEELKKQVQQFDQNAQQLAQQEAMLRQREIMGQLKIGDTANQINAQKVANDFALGTQKNELDEQRVELEDKELFYNQQSMEVANK